MNDVVLEDFSGSDQVIVVTQLRETIEAMKKQMQAKDQLILQKDQKITELKAEHFQTEKELRTRIQTIQKESSESIESLQTKNRELQKKVLTLGKNSKKISSSVYSSTPPI